ncbi:MAG: hypothetical protein LBG11_04305, partial [Bifidobacteriaceae bacterium]|nr:hypothetical protein [Bifidobacteriaceae bacterium]
MRLARRLGAILMALVLVAGVAGLVWADRRWLPEEAAAGEPEMVAVPPGDSTVVCVGAVKLPGDGEGEVIYDDRFDPHPTSVESITRGLAAGPAGAESQLLD